MFYSFWSIYCNNVNQGYSVYPSTTSFQTQTNQSWLIYTLCFNKSTRLTKKVIIHNKFHPYFTIRKSNKWTVSIKQKNIKHCTLLKGARSLLFHFHDLNLVFNREYWQVNNGQPSDVSTAWTGENIRCYFCRGATLSVALSRTSFEKKRRNTKTQRKEAEGYCFGARQTIQTASEKR